MTEPVPEPTSPLERTEEALRDCWDPETAGNNLCKLVYDLTDNERLATWADTLIALPVVILSIVLGAFVLRWLLHRAIERLAARAAEGRTPGVLPRSRASLADVGPLGTERRAQRLQTMGSLLRSIATGVIFVVATFMVIAELGYNIAPLIASAGILGVALGFGSQALVKDFLSGLFMIFEDQYGVGDVVDLGEASGIVESVGLRITRLRSVDGTVWYVRNGEIVRVGNMSYGWSRAVLDIGVAYGEDVARVRRLLGEICEGMVADEAWGELILEEPEVWGIEQLAADGVVVRVVVKTRPLEQWKIARELRERIKHRFDVEGVEIPFPQRAVWVRTEGPGAEEAEEAGKQPAGAGIGGQQQGHPAAARRPGATGGETADTPDTPEEQRRKASRKDPYRATSEEVIRETGEMPVVEEARDRSR